jgi:hypothetical protein
LVQELWHKRGSSLVNATRRSATPLTFVFGVGAIYFVIVLLSILRHEMWRDEWSTWMIAEHSASLSQLFANRAYDGHPALWYLAVYAITKVAARPVLMQLFHIMVATTSVVLVLRHSPFPLRQRLLLPFGYFLLYEYAVISRPYALGVLLLVIFCLLNRPGRERPLAQCIVLALLMQTSAYGLIVAMAFLLVPAGPLLEGVKREGRIGRLALCAAVVLVGAALSVIMMVPPSDSAMTPPPQDTYVQNWHVWHVDLSPAAVGRTLTAIWRGLVPLPTPGLHFWNTNVVGSKYLQLVLAIMVLAGTLAILRPWPRLFLVYLLGVGGMLLLSHTNDFGFLRHHGHVFLLFMACWWLTGYVPRTGGDPPARRPAFRPLLFVQAHASAIFTALLAIHVVGGVYATGMDWRYPFSSSKNVAEFLKRSGLEHALIAGYFDPAASAVAGQLDREVYYMSAERYGTFIIFDAGVLRRKSVDELVETARRISVDHSRPTVLLLNRPPPSIAGQPLVPLAEITESIELGERYHLYLLKW